MIKKTKQSALARVLQLQLQGLIHHHDQHRLKPVSPSISSEVFNTVSTVTFTAPSEFSTQFQINVHNAKILNRTETTFECFLLWQFDQKPQPGSRYHLEIGFPRALPSHFCLWTPSCVRHNRHWVDKVDEQERESSSANCKVHYSPARRVHRQLAPCDLFDNVTTSPAMQIAVPRVIHTKWGWPFKCVLWALKLNLKSLLLSDPDTWHSA